MFNEQQRKAYEEEAIKTTISLFDNLSETHNRPKFKWDIPEDPYSHWGIVATSNEKVFYIENKTRNISYKVYKDEGYYLDVNKVDGTIDIFNYYFPLDNVLMSTNYDKIKDLEPQETYIKKAVYCDDNSEPEIKMNIVVPYNRWWVYNTTNNQLISKPI